MYPSRKMLAGRNVIGALTPWGELLGGELKRECFYEIFSGGHPSTAFLPLTPTSTPKWNYWPSKSIPTTRYLYTLWQSIYFTLKIYAVTLSKGLRVGMRRDETILQLFILSKVRENLDVNLHGIKFFKLHVFSLICILVRCPDAGRMAKTRLIIVNIF